MMWKEINLRGSPAWWSDMVRALRRASMIHHKKRTTLFQNFWEGGAKVMTTMIMEIGLEFPMDTWRLINECWETELIRKETSLATLESMAKWFRLSHKIIPYKSYKNNPWPTDYEKWLSQWMPPIPASDDKQPYLQRLILCCYNAEKALEIELPSEDPKELALAVCGSQREIDFGEL